MNAIVAGVAATAAVAYASPPPTVVKRDARAPGGVAAPPATLEDLPGIGPGLAANIRRHFRDDGAFLAAAREMDLQRLTQVDGISERRAVELVRAVRGDAAEDGFLATPAARAVHERIIALLQDHAGSRHGKNRLRLLGLLHDADAAQARMRHVLAMKQQVAALDAAAVRAALRRLRSLAPPPPRCDTTRLVVAENSHAHDRLHGLGVGRWCILGTRRDLAMAGDMELVVLAYDEGMEVPGIDAVEEVSAGAGLADLAPAALLAWVDHNRAAIEACRDLAGLTARPSVAADLLAARDAVQMPRVDASGLGREVAAAHKEADAAVQAAVEGLSLTGSDLLAALRGGPLPAPVRHAIDAAMANARQRLRAATGLDFQPLVAGLPVRIDEDEVERIQRRLGAEGRLRRERSEREAARRIAQKQEALQAEVAHWLEWDADFALGSFACAHDLRAWSVGQRLAFEDAVHIDLVATADAQRIAYTVGGDAPVALLTGANSGGKSTLLEHLCQVAVLARLGLPVVGRDVEVPWVDEVHFVTARRGLDAGAFETFLRAFLPASLGNTRRLVLADEVESVTELEAAGRILAFFIERLLATRSLCVVVSHVPQAIMAHLPAGSVRIDGIEAKGLDERHRLIVDRQPRLGALARSTPELIVERLSRTTRGDEQAMYADLLDRLRH